jgi:enoyl-CoA hydratase/carnithine racemase
MPQELDEWHARAGGYVPRPSFDVYAEKYSRYFAMRRRDGIIELRMHTDGGPARFDFAVHNAWPQVWQEVGNDPDNEVLIITGTGGQWLGTPERINGPSPAHTEFALLCDITLAVETATIVDPHLLAGTAPGDGQQLTLQELIGTKRAAYHLYTGQPIGARQALELGLVNEVLPAERLLPRAWEIAEAIMKAPRTARHLTHAIAQRPWKRRLVQDLGFGMAHEMFGIQADRLLGG